MTLETNHKATALSRFPRYTLRTLLILFTVTGVWLGWFFNSVRNQRAGVAAVEELDGFVQYGDPDDLENQPGYGSPTGLRAKSRAWISSVFGQDYAYHVLCVRLGGEWSYAGQPSKFPHATEDDLKLLRAFPRLVSLELDENPITDDGLRDLLHLRFLLRLSLNKTNVTDQGMQHVRAFSRLNDLSLYGTAISDDGVKQIISCPHLTYLNLGNTLITDAGLVDIGQMSQLRHLVLSKCIISDDGLLSLQALPQLFWLDLSDTPITDAGLVHVARIQTLVIVKLSGTSITDEGVAVLANLKNLGSLDLSDTEITDVGLNQLSNLPEYCLVDVSQTKATTAGIKRLQNTLPHVSILHDGEYHDGE